MGSDGGRMSLCLITKSFSQLPQFKSITIRQAPAAWLPSTILHRTGSVPFILDAFHVIDCYRYIYIFSSSLSICNNNNIYIQMYYRTCWTCAQFELHFSGFPSYHGEAGTCPANFVILFLLLSYYCYTSIYVYHNS